MLPRHRGRKKEGVRNFFLIILAVGVVVIFFNLDIMRDGESVFSRSADKKLRFEGGLKRNNYTDKEIDRIVRYTKKHNDLFDRVAIKASPQDSYKKISPSTEILFEVHVRMLDGSTLSTTLRRTKRKDLVPSIISKLSRDMRAYKNILKKGKKIKAFINTM